MDDITQLIPQIVDLAGKHMWIPLASVVIGVLVRLLKDDSFVRWFPVTIAPKYRSWAALGLGVVGGVLAKVIGGETWLIAIAGGIGAALTAITGHDVVIESIRNGREFGEPKGGGSSVMKSMFPPAACLMLCLGIVGCAGGAKDVVTVGCQIVKAADELCPYVTVVFPDGTKEQVPRSAIAGLALDRMSARLRGEVDGGK